MRLTRTASLRSMTETPIGDHSSRRSRTLSSDTPIDRLDDELGLDDGELDLACSSCNADLTNDELFASHRVCSQCRRHYWIAARDRIVLMVDPGSFHETNAELASIEPMLFRDRLPVADRIAEEREQPAVADAVV